MRKIPETDRSAADLAIGEKGLITGFRDAELSLKLLEMGCLPGCEVELCGVAPLGCPFNISVSGYHLSLRKEEAAAILLQ
ncbi:MAG: FeoA family protein [Bacteroidota bacterium]